MDECSICLEEFSEQPTTKLKACGHTFHQECIREWAFEHMTCPICRSSLQEDDIPSEGYIYKMHLACCGYLLYIRADDHRKTCPMCHAAFNSVEETLIDIWHRLNSVLVIDEDESDLSFEEEEEYLTDNERRRRQRLEGDETDLDM